jgi:trehalose 6-phosphate phosphatase
MIDLFDAEGDAALARLACVKALYAFDFDGTLAPIVAGPDDARASERVVGLLARLATMVPTVLLTGRSVDDLRRRIAFTPLHLVGNHGAEGLPDPLHQSLAESITASGGDPDHRAVVERWSTQLPALLAAAHPDPAIEIEAKRYSLSIHYRKTPDHALARRQLEAAFEKLDPPPRIIGGKCVFNLLPEGAPDKGQALHALVRFERCEAAFFVGDDVTDEAAFVGAPESWVTVQVGGEPGSAARYCIATQEDIERCLERILTHVEAAAERTD